MVLEARWGEIAVLTICFRTFSNLKKVIALLVSFFLYDRQISLNERLSTLRTILCPFFHAVLAKWNSTSTASNWTNDEILTNLTFKARILYFKLLCLDCWKYRASYFFLAYFISYFLQILIFHLFKLHDIIYSGNFLLKKKVFFFLYCLITSWRLLPYHAVYFE